MLPGPYERWYAEIADGPSPVESRSTCDACVMEPGARGLPLEGAFDPAVRCCTYHPHLAAHFVGGILKDGTAAGIAIVRARLAARVGVTPLGLGATPAYAATYLEVTRTPGVFGRSRDLRCPFHADARCTIWSHRGAPCAAFHCKFDRGAYGAGLWNLIVVAFNSIERALARWLVETSGLDATLSDALLRAPDDRDLDVRAWGAWHGREAEYFLVAARRIEPMSWVDVAAIGGRELADLGAALGGAATRFAAMVPPTRVQRGTEVLHRIGLPGHKVLHHPALPFDELAVSTELADRLARLETSELADLGLDAELVRRLLDWRVLVPAAE